MGKYINTDESGLLEILMSNTTIICKKISQGIYNGEEFVRCRDTLLEIQSEIKDRIAAENSEQLATNTEQLTTNN